MASPVSQPSSKRIKGSMVFIAVIIAALALVVAGIEIARRLKVPADTVTAVPAAAKPFPRELRDAKGETLSLPREPQRIVSQTLGTDEILLAICPQERVVALSDLAEDGNYSNAVEQARQIPGRTTEGPEQILQFKPDLIFVASYSRAETVELLKASGAPVFRFANFDSIADIKSNIRTIGYATGTDAAAEKLIRQMDEALTAVRARIPKNKSPVRVMSYDKLGYTAGSNTIFDDVVRATGAVNVSAEQGIKAFAKIDSEKILEWQPDFLIMGANRGKEKSVRDRLLEDPAVAASAAGRAGRIVVIDNRRFLTVSQHVVGFVEDLANGIYGDRK
ncbi:MAG TPA: ABC transporter substrate-binding protein [Blastocatellia bacterium]|nr:ABC transporter substrate-binding protein [Blastocatellia bacterium]